MTISEIIVSLSNSSANDGKCYMYFNGVLVNFQTNASETLLSGSSGAGTSKSYEGICIVRDTSVFNDDDNFTSCKTYASKHISPELNGLTTIPTDFIADATLSSNQSDSSISLGNTSSCIIQITGTFSSSSRGILYESGSHGRGLCVYIYEGKVYCQAGSGGVIGGDVELSSNIDVELVFPGSFSTNYLVPVSSVISNEDAIVQTYTVPSFVEASFAVLNVGTIVNPIINVDYNQKQVTYSYNSLTIDGTSTDAILVSKVLNVNETSNSSTLSTSLENILVNLTNRSDDIFKSYKSSNTNDKIKGGVANSLISILFPGNDANLVNENLAEGAIVEYPSSNLSGTKLNDLLTNLESLVRSVFTTENTDSLSFDYWRNYVKDSDNNVSFSNDDKLLFVYEIPYTHSNGSGSMKAILSWNISIV